MLKNFLVYLNKFMNVEWVCVCLWEKWITNLLLYISLYTHRIIILPCAPYFFLGNVRTFVYIIYLFKKLEIARLMWENSFSLWCLCTKNEYFLLQIEWWIFPIPGSMKVIQKNNFLRNLIIEFYVVSKYQRSKEIKGNK